MYECGYSTQMGIRTAIRKLVNRLGYDVRKIDPNLEIPYFQNALDRWKSYPLDFKSVIDVGASDGRWSLQFAGTFPEKRYLLVDANPVHESALKKVCSTNPNWSYKRCAVGKTEGVFYFEGTDPLGGHLSEQQLGPTYKPCAVSTLDSLVQEFNLPPPIFVKLDTHGVEVPILEGAKKSLPYITGLAVEVYNFEANAPQVPFWEFCRYLRQLNFRPLDLWDILHRPKDKALWQFDMLFVRADFPLLQDPRFR